VFFGDFDPAGRRLLVVGCLEGRDIEALLGALRADEFDTVFCCTAPSPRGVPVAQLAAAARAIGCETVYAYDTVLDACSAAVRTADSDDAVLVAGSLYVVGGARGILRRLIP
jgi:folylpolyglutamate synthase/dihydropteroate synthase